MNRSQLLLAALLVFSVSCQKTTTDPEATDPQATARNVGLVGRWQLVEYLADPGDGSGKYQKVTDATAERIEFKADGRFLVEKANGSSAAQTFESYRILDGNRLEMKFKAPSNNNPTRLWYYADLSPTTLTLSYGCIEACSGKYIAVE